MYQITIKSDLLSAAISIFGFLDDLNANHVCVFGWGMYGGILCLRMSLGV